MAATYTPIASITLGAAAASVTFSSIPQTYTDLVLVTAGTSTSGQQICIRFNGATTNYSTTILTGSGSTAGSIRYTATSFMFLGYDAYFSSGQANSIIHIMNYANATTFKTVLSRENNAATGVALSAGTSRNTSAVTQIDAIANVGSWGSGTTFNLYGILGANA
jgi:hypothetical protein